MQPPAPGPTPATTDNTTPAVGTTIPNPLFPPGNPAPIPPGNPAPLPLPATTPGVTPDPNSVPNAAGIPMTVTGGTGGVIPNPLLSQLSGVQYSAPAYAGAPQAGLGASQVAPGYGGLTGQPLYVGGQQVGWHF